RCAALPLPAARAPPLRRLAGFSCYSHRLAGAESEPPIDGFERRDPVLSGNHAAGDVVVCSQPRCGLAGDRQRLAEIRTETTSRPGLRAPDAQPAVACARTAEEMSAIRITW